MLEIANVDSASMGVCYVGHRLAEAKIISILEHEARGEGDKWYYDLILDNGDKIRLFDVGRVYYSEKVGKQ